MEEGELKKRIYSKRYTISKEDDDVLDAEDVLSDIDEARKEFPERKVIGVTVSADGEEYNEYGYDEDEITVWLVK